MTIRNVAVGAAVVKAAERNGKRKFLMIINESTSYSMLLREESGGQRYAAKIPPSTSDEYSYAVIKEPMDCTREWYVSTSYAGTWAIVVEYFG